MKSSPKSCLTLKTLERVAACLVIVGVLLSSLGVVVVSPTKSNSSQAYLCQGGTCGCSSAAQCWSNCCCTTVGERLAWAELNEVTPPGDFDDVLAAAEDRPATGRTGQTREDSPATPGARVVLLSNASDCRGLPQYIAVFGSVICQAVPTAAHPPLLMTGWIRTADASTNSPLTSPPTPPPRLHV